QPLQPRRPGNASRPQRGDPPSGRVRAPGAAVVRADPAGLAALAARLTATASTTVAAIPVGVAHPPLAADTVSAGAAARLNASGTILAGNAGSQVADLGALAARLAM